MSNLSSVLAAPLTPNARATSRLVTRAGGFTLVRRGRARRERRAPRRVREERPSGRPGNTALSARGRDADRGLGIFFRQNEGRSSDRRQSPRRCAATIYLGASDKAYKPKASVTAQRGPAPVE